MWIWGVARSSAAPEIFLWWRASGSKWHRRQRIACRYVTSLSPYALPCQRAWEHESQSDPAGQARREADCRQGFSQATLSHCSHNEHSIKTCKWFFFLGPQMTFIVSSDLVGVLLFCLLGVWIYTKPLFSILGGQKCSGNTQLTFIDVAFSVKTFWPFVMIGSCHQCRNGICVCECNYFPFCVVWILWRIIFSSSGQ